MEPRGLRHALLDEIIAIAAKAGQSGSVLRVRQDAVRLKQAYPTGFETDEIAALLEAAARLFFARSDRG
jgi:hypothetical protein